MTREEASFYLVNMDRKYMEEGMSEALDMAIKALSSSEKPNKWIDAEMLDKIRAEIETDLSHFCFDEWGNENPTWKEIKAIIGKYKEEGSEK